MSNSISYNEEPILEVFLTQNHFFLNKKRKNEINAKNYVKTSRMKYMKT